MYYVCETLEKKPNLDFDIPNLIPKIFSKFRMHPEYFEAANLNANVIVYGY